MKQWITRIFTAMVFLFLIAPILVLILFSFNESKSLSVFSGGSIHWYLELFRDQNTWESIRNSLLLACSSTTVAVVMGTFAAWEINRLCSWWYQKTISLVTEIPMINPDIITGISFLLMFVFMGGFLGSFSGLNFFTMLIAHITFCLPYVILQVLPKCQQMDPSLKEAAMDLGCTTTKVFFKVELPEILPGILTGGMMAFTMSLDDFVISYFTAGNGFETLPIRIYGMTKKTVTPKMYALATILFLVTLSMLMVVNMIGDEEKNTKLGGWL